MHFLLKKNYLIKILCLTLGTLSAYAIHYEEAFKEEEITLNREDNFVIVSLGCNCIPAHHMRECNVRPFALPFDWTLVPFQALYTFIQNDFKDYFKKEHLIPSSKPYLPAHLHNFVSKLGYSEMAESPLWVLDKESGMVFVHDFSNNCIATIEKYHESQYMKYSRRIKRFYDELSSGKKIYFIRYLDITKTDALRLWSLLKDKFPTVDFTLIVIGDYNEFEKDWEAQTIKNFSIHGFSWQRLFNNIMQRTL